MTTRRSTSLRVDLLVLVGLVAVTGWFVIVGADTMWAVALGDLVRHTGSVPQGVPFAAAADPGWVNPLVLGELVLSLVNAAGPAGLALAQVVLVAATLAILVGEAHRGGASSWRTAAVLVLVFLAALPQLVVARLPSLSLVPFVLLLMIIRRDAANPSQGIWWGVALVAVWANLHGGVLIGEAVLGVYLVVGRLRRAPTSTVAVLVGSLVAAGLATPALTQTPSYYLGVLGNEAARRGTDLWAPLTLGHTLDVVLIVAAVVLLAMCRRHRPRVWELVALVGLAAGTVMTARNGVWLVLLLAVPAALAAAPTTVRTDLERPAAKVGWTLPAAVALSVLLAFPLVVGRGTATSAPGLAVVPALRELTTGHVVLAPEPLVETLAQGGVRVWASNPIDAFPHPVQAAYLDYLHAGVIPNGLPSDVRLVVRQGEHPAGWQALGQAAGWVVLARP